MGRQLDLLTGRMVCAVGPLLRWAALAICLLFLVAIPPAASQVQTPGHKALANAHELSNQYRYAQALDAYTLAEKLFLASDDLSGRDEARMGQAAMAGILGDAERAFSICLGVLRDNPKQGATTAKFRAAIFMATTFIEVGDSAGARKMLDIAKPMLGRIEFAPAYATYHQARSHLAFSEGRFGESIAEARLALGSLDKVPGAARPAFPMIWYGRSLTAQSNPDEGLVWLDRAINSTRKGGHDLAEAFAQHGKAEALLALRRTDEARRASDRMIAAIERFNLKTGTGFFDSAAKTADMLALHAQLGEGRVADRLTAQRYRQAFQAMEMHYDRLRDDSVGIYRASLDAALLEADLQSAREEEQAALELADSQRTNAILGFAVAILALGAAALGFILYRRTLGQRELLSKGFSDRGTLIAEIQHRAKNNLQLIISLLNIERRALGEADLQQMTNRVRAMASLHDRLQLLDDSRQVDITPVIAEIVQNIDASYGSGKVSIGIASVPCILDVDVAAPLILMVTEMCTNAYKHALTRYGGNLNVVIMIGNAAEACSASLVVSNSLRDMAVWNELGSGLGFDLIYDMASQAGCIAKCEMIDKDFRWTVTDIPLASAIPSS
jgi:two-component sensor histidine kinase